jgi:hypothetical protein
MRIESPANKSITTEYSGHITIHTPHNSSSNGNKNVTKYISGSGGAGLHILNHSTRGR